MEIMLIVLVAFSVSLAIFLFIKDRKTAESFKKQKLEMTKKDYEIAVLNKIQDEIGYTVNLKKIIEEIGKKLEDFFLLSTFSYAVIDENRIVLETHVKETINKEYVDKIKEIMINSLSALDQSIAKSRIEEELSGMLSEGEMSHPQSYFNVPFIIGGKCVGLLTMSSKIKNVFKEEEVDYVYNLVNQITKTIDKTVGIIETEKGKLASMLASLPNGAFMFLFLDDTFKVSMINEAAKGFLHINDEPNTIRVISSFGIAIDLLKEVKNVLREKKTNIFDDVNLYGKFFKIILSPVFLYRSENVIGVSVTMEDMTVEKELQKIREDFNNMVVHELRAPLTAIKGASELIASGKLPPEESSKMINIIKSSTKRMLGQVGDILDVAKIQAGKFSIIKKGADLNSLIKEKYEEFSIVASTKNIGMGINVVGDIPGFEFDNERIGQVLNNLISNSIKFTQSGGKIEIGAKSDSANVLVWVKDNGAGISKEKQSLLFSRYTQVTDFFRKEGTGLGLYIVKSIVESHNGKIWVESHEGQGSAFYFTIPIIISSSEQNKEIPVSAGTQVAASLN